MVETKIRDQVFQLTDQATDVTGTDIATTRTSLWLQGWKCQVPVDVTLVFRPEDTFSAYMQVLSSSTEFTAADKVRIRTEDPSNADSKLILGPVLYTQIDEFQDRDLIKTLDISREIIVPENHWVIIECYVGTSLDASECYWALTCRRIRHAIF